MKISSLIKAIFAISFIFLISTPVFACNVDEQIGKVADTESIDSNTFARIASQYDEG